MTKTKTQNANEEILSAEELMKKFDKDSKSRNLTGPLKYIYGALLIAFAVYILHIAYVSYSFGKPRHWRILLVIVYERGSGVTG